MPDRCDKCGIVALESQSFTEERIPFRRPKRYCPACHQKFHQRVYLVVVVLILVLGTIEIGAVLRGRREVAAFSGLWWLLICMIQWLMIVPHELGHAMGVPSDPSHQWHDGHCTDPRCVMYPTVDGKAILSAVFEFGPPKGFCDK